MRILALVASITALAGLAGTSACSSRADWPERPARKVGPAAATPGPDANDVAAEVVGKKVTVGEIDDQIADQLAAARATYEMSLYDARKAALDARIESEVLQAEAGKRGVTVDALVAAEVDGKVAAPTEAEAQALYDQFKDQMDGASYDTMKPRLLEHISQERMGSRRSAFIAELRKANGVKLLLEPPRTKVEAKGPSRGPDNAKVTIVIFSDFECPFCAKAWPTLEQIRKTWPNDVRMVFRNYPLPFHPSARPAAEAAACAAEQGKFWELHDNLFTSRELGTDAIRVFLGKQEGFDLGKYDECLSSGRGAAVVDADVAAAGTVQVDSTPHFFVNGIRVSGAQSFDYFEGIIDSELSR